MRATRAGVFPTDAGSYDPVGASDGPFGCAGDLTIADRTAMTTLVTGGTGFVGSAVVRLLVEMGATVRVLVRPDADRRNLDGLPVQPVEGDLTDPESLRVAVRGCSALYHVAALFEMWTPQPDRLYRTNIDGTVDLLMAAADAGVGRIVYTSSVAALGAFADGRRADERTPVSLSDMTGAYKRSKFLAEEAVRRLVREHALPVVIVNPSTPVGPGDRKPTPTGRLVLDAAAGRLPAYVDTGLNIVHVDDVAEGHIRAFERGRIGERYILGGENLSLEVILHKIAALAGGTAPRWRLPASAVLPLAYAAEGLARLSGGGAPRLTVDAVRIARRKMYYSCAKAERELGYTHRPADQALADAVAWFRDEGMLPVRAEAAPR